MNEENLSVENWRYIAETLWYLLAAIENASEMFKPESESYYEYVVEKTGQRFEFMECEASIENEFYLIPIKYD